MSKEKGAGHSKFFRVFGIIGASLFVLAAGWFTAFLVMDAMGVNYYVMEGPRQYLISFRSENNVVSEKYYDRGSEVVVPPNPTHSENKDYVYSFKGWDLTGNGFVDAIPHRVYYSFTAVALYNATYIGKPEEEEPVEEPTQIIYTIFDYLETK